MKFRFFKLRKKTKKIIIIVAAAFASLALLIGASALYIDSLLSSELPIDKETFVTIPKNADIDATMKALNQQGLFKPSFIFTNIMRFYAKTSGRRIFAGCYRLMPENTNLQLLKSLFTGNQLLTIKVTYPEGISLKEFADITEKKLGTPASEFMHEAKNDSLLRAFKIDAPSAEGYLMPDTYEFFWKQSAEEIISKMLALQLKLWNERFRGKFAQQKLTKHQILTLASIVESESPLESERPRVSGVYVNRLGAGMKLCADPTVQYAIGEKKRLFNKDLEFDSPYNTYKYEGLPPGPINSPSLSSIAAALSPERHNYYYFVAVGDGSGRHNFAASGNEHSRNVAQYRKNYKKNKK